MLRSVAAERLSPEARVSASIRDQLLAEGFACGEIEELPITVAEWRQLARRTARELGQSVNTSVVRSTVCARLLTLGTDAASADNGNRHP